MITLRQSPLAMGCPAPAAFARPRRGEEEIAGSLAFTQALFTRAAQHRYHPSSTFPRRRLWAQATSSLVRSAAPAPETPYAQAKLASELMLASAMQYNRQVCGTSLRISTLAGGRGSDECDLLSRLSIQALRGESLTMLGGVNRMSRWTFRMRLALFGLCCAFLLFSGHPCYNVIVRRDAIFKNRSFCGGSCRPSFRQARS